MIILLDGDGFMGLFGTSISFEKIVDAPVRSNHVALMWFNDYSGVAVKTPEDVLILVDPVGVPSKELDMIKPDLILVSYENKNHFDSKLLEKLHKNQSTIIAPASVTSALKNISGNLLRTISAGGEIEEKGIKICAEKSDNDSDGAVTFVLTIDKITMYLCGDSKAFEGMQEIGEKHDIDVAMLPVGMAPGISPEDSARAAEMLKPRTVIPYHGKKGFEELGSNISELAQGTVTIHLNQGELYNYLAHMDEE